MEKKVSFEIRAISVPDYASDPEEKEVSDDDDDDRNHKHRKRDISSHSIEGDRHKQYFSVPYRKRAKTLDKGDSSFEKPHHYMTNFSRFPIEANQRHPLFSGNLGTDRGRGRDSGSWSQRDLRVDKFDIACQMGPPGPIPPPFFSGRGLHSGLNMQNAACAGGFGLNIGLPRQICRDFEERGFCLRGDMCPIEHGVNRIVIEDVQSLSQFNLPGSLAGNAIDPQVNASSGVFIDNSGYALNGAPDEVVDGSGADFYDPDQPLWNNDCSLQTPASFMDSDPSSQLVKSSSAASGVQSTSSSVWGRMNASENRVVSRPKADSRVTSSEFESATKEKCTKLQKHTGQSFKNPAQKAVRSLYVKHIPLKDNKKEALLSHFKKFGEVIDIYIPPNTEHAFVQFSKREEAERALRSPDAVMGNRFIRLLWAYRDSFFPGGVGGKDMARMPDHMQETSALPHHITANTSKANIQRVVPLVSGPKVPTATPVHKKLENLELMKEEVRKKQELLEQRRKEFCQKLDKLQKNATGVKGEVQASKKLKVEGPDDSPKHSKLQVAGVDMPPGGSLHKPVESSTLYSLKSKLSAASQELSNLKQAARPPAFNGSPYPTNRYKLDNRPTSFRVKAPLPAGFANVTAIRDHFVGFGDLSNVDLENSDVQGEKDKCSEKATNMSAHVSFKTRQAAERAFVNGKSWNGHSLQLTWLMPTKSPGNSPKPSGSGTEIQSMEKSTCDVSQESRASLSAGSSVEASGPGSTDSEVVEKEEHSKSVIGEIGEAQGDAG